MKNILRFFLLAFCLFGVSPLAFALLAQRVPPEHARLTVYRNANLAWVEGVFRLALSSNENRLLFPQQESFAGRLLLRPLDATVELVKTEKTLEGTLITVRSPREGEYPFLLGFFLHGFNWDEAYFAHLKGSTFTVAPAVLVENESQESFENITLSWLSGSPIFEEAYALKAEAEADTAAMGRVPESAPAPIQMERVSEYEVYTFPEKVDIPRQTVLQVFPEIRTFSGARFVRYQNERPQSVLSLENQGEPLPAGTMLLTLDDTFCELPFPGIRTGETLELLLPLPPPVSVTRRLREYVREEAHFNKDRELTGFVSTITVTFTVENPTEEEVVLEIRENLLSSETIPLPPEWRWENAQAVTRLTLKPGEEKTLPLSYRFKEARP